MKQGSLKNRVMSHKVIAFIVLLVLFMGIATIGAVVVRAPGPEKEGQKNQQSGKVTMTGMLVCLPHKNTDGPQTLECAYGFKSNTGDYYAVKDESAGQSKIGSVPFNTSVEMSGFLHKESSDAYQMIGTVTVENIKELTP